ncbi:MULTISPECIES: hypothetical protein [Streptomyces]|uniref:hypothetical protein n=1 Tax=Streptomyces TaxID=1883 RepID=UPI0036589535
MDWTQLLKDLTGAVEARNRSVTAVRVADTNVTELAAQAFAAGAQERRPPGSWHAWSLCSHRAAHRSARQFSP